METVNWTRLALAASIAAALGSASEPASAQKSVAAPSELEEIVVTARKREESIQDAPLTIQAFNTTQLEDRGVEGLDDLTKYTPGLTFNGGTSRANSDFSVRGMAQVAATGDNRRDLVTVFIDNVPYIGTPAGLGAEDLARVEVIKGPQSALFGRATFGGAISMITTTPGDEVKGRVSVTAAEYGDRRATVALEGPLVKGLLAGRLVFDGSDFDGFYQNALGGRLGESKQRYYAGTLSFTPTDDLSFKVRYSDRHDVDGEAASTLLARYTEHNCGPFEGYKPRSLFGLPAGMTLPQSRMVYCGPIEAPSGSVGINTTIPEATIGKVSFDEHKLVIDHTLLSATMEWQFLGGYTLTATASDQSNDVESLLDFDRTELDRYQSTGLNEQGQEAYEIRVSSPAEQRLTWMVGIARLEADFTTTGGFIYGEAFGPAAGGPPLPLVPNINSSKTDSVFGSIGFDFSDKVNLSLELRRQKDTVTSGIGTSTPFAIDTTSTLPRLLMLWKVTDNSNVYFNYAEGNQPAQGYATYFQLTPEQQPIALANGVTPGAPEAKVTNYEIGFKHRSADGSWYVNAAAFYLEWRDRMSLRTMLVDLNGDGSITLVPAPQGEVFNVVPFGGGDSDTLGFEVESALNVTPQVSIGGSAAYAYTDVTKALSEPILLNFMGDTDGAGQKWPLVPEFSAAAFAQYEQELSGSYSWYARMDGTYVGKRYTSIANFSWVPSQVRANLRVGLRAQAWDVTVFVNNLFNDDTVEWARSQGDSAADPYFFQLSGVESALANKQQIGVVASYRF